MDKELFCRINYDYDDKIEYRYRSRDIISPLSLEKLAHQFIRVLTKIAIVAAVAEH